MLELRQELVALIAWKDVNVERVARAEMDAVAQRIIRMADLLRRMREIAARN